MVRRIFFWRMVLFFGLALLLSGCNLPVGNSDPPGAPASIDLPPPANQQSTAPEFTPTPPLASDAPTYRVRFRITSTSDWATLRLLSGGNWYNVEVLTSSEEADKASFEGNALSISQPLNGANAGKDVELVAEALLAHLDPDQPLIFEIERGHLGNTQVEIFRAEEDAFAPVTTLSWAGTQPTGSNAEHFEVSPLPFLSSTANEYIIIAQINFWYYGDGEFGGFENQDGSRATPFTPLYGQTYYASDPDWVYQQIEWAVEYGVDAFSIEWTTPRGIGCCGSMEDTLDDVFLVSPNIHKIRWAIFYDFVLRMRQTEEFGMVEPDIFNFDLPAVYDTFVEDFVHFATKYFHHPQYLTIDGRPVVYIWASNAFFGNFAGAMAEARQKVADLGYDVYIVGDEVCYGCFNRAHAALFDGSSTFTFLIPGVDHWGLKDVGHAAESTDIAYSWWRSRIAGLQVTGRDDPVNFQPAWAPQYDESWINDRPQPMVVQAASKEQVIQMAEVNRKHAEPAGEEGLKLVWVNTWNCWGEGTTIEPTIEEDKPKYPVGNYGFDFLEIIREVFGVETYYTSP